MDFSTFLWTTFGVFVTLSIFSFLYKDNPFYKFAEHLVVGVSAGYFVVILWHNGLMPNLFHRLADGDEPTRLGHQEVPRGSVLGARRQGQRGDDADGGETLAITIAPLEQGLLLDEPRSLCVMCHDDPAEMGHDVLHPPAADEYGSAWLEPITRIAVVPQFCSWSAWRMNSTSMARSSTGSTS